MQKNILETTDRYLKDVPAWEHARPHIMPYLEPVASSAEYTPALRSADNLAGMLTNRIKMCAVFIYKDVIVPLSEMLLRYWRVSWHAAAAAMDENMARLSRMISLQEHVSPFGVRYMSLHHPAPAFASVLAFYKPVRNEMHRRFGDTYYLSVPENSTAIMFARSELPLYMGRFRNDILLTHDCSAHPLSSELLEVAPDGIVTLIE